MSDVTPSKADDSTEDSTEPATEGPAIADPTTEHTLLPADDPAHEPVSEPLADVTSDPVVETSHETGPVLVEPQETAAPETAEFRAAVAEPVAEPAIVPVVAESDTTATGEATPVVVPTAVPAASAVPAQQQVYLQPELPPKRRGNRLIGVLLSLVGAAIFAGIYAVVVVVINHLEGGRTFGKPSSEFINVFGSAYFTVAVGAFLVLMILLVLLLNRAGWWAHVLGSLILAIAVYFVAIGGLLFIGNTLKYSPETLTFAGLAVSPWVIAAAVVAREVSIWTGLAIAARGRRVKVRNVEARAAFDREQEAKKAEYAATGPVAGY